jgi:tryptophanyl-tRNA synthetase
MSKSYDNTIDIFEETEKKLRKKIMKIVTDSTPVEESKNPEGSYIVQLYQLFSSPEVVAEMEASFRAGGQGYGHYKEQLFVAIRDYFAPMRERREELLKDPSYVDDVLADGAKRAKAQARVVMDRVRKAIGM